MAEEAFQHQPVMANEVVENLAIKPDGVYIDGTLGGGGHTELIAERLSAKGRLIGIDQDIEAINSAKSRLAKYDKKIVYFNSNFIHLDEILSELKIEKVDGVLLDLGVSSYQLNKLERGFSFREIEENLKQELDMRMDQRQDFCAYDVVNGYKEDELVDIFFKYGEEKFSRSIARRIVEDRKDKKIITIGQLMEIIRRAMPPKYRSSKHGGTYASNIFRAIRIEVNDELKVVEEVIPQAVDALKSGGRLVVITFHSLEDRIVKHSFRNLAQGDDPKVKLITKKPVLPTLDEIKENSRAASAKLRVVENI